MKSNVNSSRNSVSKLKSQIQNKSELANYLKDAFNIQVINNLKSFNKDLLDYKFAMEACGKKLTAKPYDQIQLLHCLYNKLKLFKELLNKRDYLSIKSVFDDNDSDFRTNDKVSELMKKNFFFYCFIELVINKYPFEECSDDAYFDQTFALLINLHNDIVKELDPEGKNTLTQMEYDFELMYENLRWITDIEKKAQFLRESKIVLLPYLPNETTKAYRFHFNLRCDLEIKKIETIIRLSEATKHSDSDVDSSSARNKEFTLARQVLAIHFLLKYCSISPIDKPRAVASFIQFLTQRELGAKRIENTTIYKKVQSPFTHNEDILIRDLEFIKDFFEKMDVKGIVANIQKEILASENTLNQQNKTKKPK